SHNLVRIDCWYMSRLTRRFVRVTPQVCANNLLPGLPIIGWHLAQRDRFGQEIEALTRAKYTVSVDEYNTDEQPPLEICLTIARNSGQIILLVVTQPDYPASRPGIHTVSMTVLDQIPQDADLFEALWKKSIPLPKDAYPDWEWTDRRTILDLVQEVEAKL